MITKNEKNNNLYNYLYNITIYIIHNIKNYTNSRFPVQVFLTRKAALLILQNISC